MYQTKDCFAEIKDVNIGKGIVEGYFATFNNVDADGDIIRPGAFKKSIQENGPDSGKARIMHLLQHSTREPLGKPQELAEDDFGLRFVTQIVKTTYGLDTLKLYDAEVYNEHSIGFETIQSNPEDGLRILTELKLWEGSTVTWGANSQTPTTGMKDLTKATALEKVRKLTKAVHDGTFTDDTFHLLEIQLKQLERFITDHLSDDPEPPESTSIPMRPDDLKAAFANIHKG